MKKIEFEHHLDCPYIRPGREPGMAAYCKKYFRSIETLKFPDWCGLEDVIQPVDSGDTYTLASLRKMGAGVFDATGFRKF